jgi:hypothetical protein
MDFSSEYQIITDLGGATILFSAGGLPSQSETNALTDNGEGYIGFLYLESI